MNDPRVVIPAAGARVFEIAGLRARLESQAGSASILLPPSYEGFSSTSLDIDLEIRLGSRSELAPTKGRLVYDSLLHWRALSDSSQIVFELAHPPTSRVYCRARMSADFSRAEVLFSEAALRQVAPRQTVDWELPYPLDQLLLVPALAQRGVVLLHASGAVLPTGAAVFAGHSGDGKTTISGILTDEGVPLLSDERVAIRKTDAGFVAYGTPWPGEGNVVSSERAPLKALYVLEKSESHSIGESPVASLVPEVVARAIVPYYLPDIASRILELFADLSTRVPVRKLSFARRPGLRELLQAA